MLVMPVPWSSTRRRPLTVNSIRRGWPGPGVDEGMVRMSVGLEDPADLIADLKRALRASAGLDGVGLGAALGPCPRSRG